MLFYWLLAHKKKKQKTSQLLGYMGLTKNTKGQTYSEPDVGMRFTANMSNVWAQTSKFSDFIPFEIAEHEWEWVGLL